MNEFRKQLVRRMSVICGAYSEIVADFKNCCKTYPENDWNNSILNAVVSYYERLFNASGFFCDSSLE